MSTSSPPTYLQSVLTICAAGFSFFYVILAFALNALLFMIFHHLLSFAIWGVCGTKPAKEVMETWFTVPALLATLAAFVLAVGRTAVEWNTVHTYDNWYAGVFAVQSQMFVAVGLFEVICAVLFLGGWFVWKAFGGLGRQGAVNGASSAGVHDEAEQKELVERDAAHTEL